MLFGEFRDLQRKHIDQLLKSGNLFTVEIDKDKLFPKFCCSINIHCFLNGAEYACTGSVMGLH